jgi:hypothetical protein
MNDLRAAAQQALRDLERAEARIETVPAKGGLLSIHPPRREWVSLTDEERIKIIEFGSTLADIARAIEAALKERNT